MAKVPKNMYLERPLAFAHAILDSSVRPGDIVIDATAGRGHDTVKLCGLVGPQGQVFSVDIQEDAIASTRQAVAAEFGNHHVSFVCDDHRKLVAIIPENVHGHVSAICYNLGYLPGSDKTVITTALSTIESLNAATSLLAPGGIITVVIYSGHDGGQQEMEAVLSWGQDLSQELYTVYSYSIINQINRPPMLMVVQKKV